MIAGLYFSLLTLLFFRISVDTIKARRRHQVSVGNGPGNEIAHLTSAHANFSSYTPFFLVGLFFLELSATSQPVLVLVMVHALGLSFTFGRLFHYLAFRTSTMNFKYRKIGMHLTLWPLLLLAVAHLAVLILKLWGAP
jgi:uncharacterized protein